MKPKSLLFVKVVFLSLVGVFSLMVFSSFGQASSGLVVTTAGDAPSVTVVTPNLAPNDLDTTIVITGTGFAIQLPDILPTVLLNNTPLVDVVWTSATQLSATVPWGLTPGLYTLTVQNPDGQSGNLTNAFTVSQGFGVWTTGGPYGGRVDQILVRPDETTNAYAVVSMVGAFATFDGGENWEPMVRLDNPTRLVLDAVNPDVIYCGGSGLQADNLRSMDGGQTWTSYFDEFHPADGSYFSYPVAHPTQAGAIYLATGGSERTPVRPLEGGVYYSTDYGATWQERKTGLTDTDLVDLAIHPDNPQILAAAARNGKIFTTADGGLHWQLAFNLNRPLRRIYFNPYGIHEAWVVPNNVYQPPQTVALFKSSNAGLTAWQSLQTTNELSPAGGIWTLAFKANAIWAGGDWGYISKDGGATWDSVMGVNGEINQVQTFAFTPGDDQKVYVGSAMMGVGKSLDGGDTWVEKNEGLAGLQVRSLVVPPGEIDTIYANTFERGILRSDDAGKSWLELNMFRVGAPKGTLLAVDPFDSNRLYLGDACGDTPCMKISADRGNTWHEVPMTIPDPWVGWIGEVVSVAPHPNIPGRILAGAGFCETLPDCNTGAEPAGIYASDNYGENWTYLGPTSSIKEVRMFAFDVTDNNLIYAGTNGQGLWRTTDGGSTWAEVTIPGVLSPVFIDGISTHPDLSGTVYVRLYSYANSPNPQPNLFVSKDAGATWLELPDTATVTGGIGGFGLVFMPPAPDASPYQIYAGCQLGLCRTLESTWNWEAVAGSPRPSSNMSLVAASNEQLARLYVGTPGGVMAPLSTSALAAEIPGLGQLLNGGVYRQTMVLANHWIYLPLIFR